MDSQLRLPPIMPRALAAAKSALVLSTMLFQVRNSATCQKS